MELQFIVVSVTKVIIKKGRLIILIFSVRVYSWYEKKTQGGTQDKKRFGTTALEAC